MKLTIFAKACITMLAVLTLHIPVSLNAAEQSARPPPETYCDWQVADFAIDTPLCGYSGDVARGKVIVSDAARGNCLACHQLPIEGIEAYGTIGPPLAGVGSRLPVGHLRLRVVDTRHISPMSIMPGYYRKPELINRPGKAYLGRTFLNAQQIEDVIAYLVTLK
ncbi:MAG: sulfur oxidation c-type cytochrome SoxX [Gammaproteobacteria bacterium]